MPEEKLTSDIIQLWQDYLNTLFKEPSDKKFREFIMEIRKGYYPLEKNAIGKANELISNGIERFIGALRQLNETSSRNFLHIFSLLSYYISDPQSSPQKLLVNDLLMSLCALLYEDRKGKEIDKVKTPTRGNPTEERRKLSEKLAKRLSLQRSPLKISESLCDHFLKELCIAELAWPLQEKKAFWMSFCDILEKKRYCNTLIDDYVQGVTANLEYLEEPKKRARKTKIISVNSMKGGVGKTTLAFCIADLLLKEKKKVALVDFDFSGSLMSLLVPSNGEVASNKDYRRLFHLFGSKAEKKELRKTAKEIQRRYKADLTIWTNPASLVWQQMLSWRMSGNEKYLKDLLEELEATSRFDFIILDCSPGLVFGNEKLLNYLKVRNSALIIVSSSDALDIILNSYNMHWDVYYTLLFQDVHWIANKRIKPGPYPHFVDWLQAEVPKTESPDELGFINEMIDYYEYPEGGNKLIKNKLHFYSINFDKALAEFTQFDSFESEASTNRRFEKFIKTLSGIEDQIMKSGLIRILKDETI
ncbi:MAG: ParA family protein [Candidatus Abyssobacteria bacterium SURF_5]|uniref:ParA family protein n=1 Tax=Abyssobacteria bacterium (strain SURF_5) TaxID=2093360 RepID=A0A3A4NC82_ABYX5|nr:MAG: ParA family protein [Candidatus Abyssubacteria bacterium SURF_5]